MPPVIVCPGTDAWNQALAERLESEESSSFFFYPCETEDAGLAMAEGLTRENTEADYYLAVQTRFVRQRNRLTGQMNVVAENCRKWISGWGK